jgi:sugar/nucleoside kinase (ribokinase family)
MDAIPARPFDPLAAVRSPSDAGFDVLLAGTVFQDIIFTGLPHGPEPGTEIWSDGMGSCPGGVANQAIAASRLGLRTGLAAAFGDDGYGDFNWKILAGQEHVDLSLSRKVPGWHSPVTVSLCVDKDRSLVTHGHAAPVTSSELIGDPPAALAGIAEVGLEVEPWAKAAYQSGVKLFGDVGWDPSGVWAPVRLENLQYFHAFLPNQREAMAFTGKDDPWTALYALADRVPVAVVTLGPQGAMAVDSETGEEEWVHRWEPGRLAAREQAPFREPLCVAGRAGSGWIAGRTRVGRHRRLVETRERPPGTADQPMAAALRLPGRHHPGRPACRPAPRHRHYRAPLGRVTRRCLGWHAATLGLAGSAIW